MPPTPFNTPSHGAYPLSHYGARAAYGAPMSPASQRGDDGGLRWRDHDGDERLPGHALGASSAGLVPGSPDAERRVLRSLEKLQALVEARQSPLKWQQQ